MKFDKTLKQINVQRESKAAAVDGAWEQLMSSVMAAKERP